MLSLVVLVAALGAAAAADRRLPGPVVAAAGALVLLGAGAVGAHRAGDAIRQLAPTIGFLAALLVLAEGCRRAGVFAWLGGVMAQAADGGARRLLALIFAAATAVTVVLGLDATVVLLTPIVVATTAGLGRSPRAPAYATVHLANSASLLLPVSNLTNLLAFHAAHLAFARFGLLMLAPTGWAVAVDWIVLRRLDASEDDPGPAVPGPRPPVGVPRFALSVVALTLVAFVASSAIGLAPVWVAVAGAAVITVPGLATPAATGRGLARAVQPGFLVFVAALAVIVAAAGDHGLTHAVDQLLPAGSSLGALLAIAAIAGVLANLVNNLPATLLLVGLLAGHGPGPLLAMLIGVGIGPNLTEVGSLATLLWRRELREASISLPRREFVALGLVTVPAALGGATVLLWLALRFAG